MAEGHLSLKMRLALAVVAVGLIHFAFYFIPRYVATRPRFYEAAYNEALEILKQEVGPAAVEKGLCLIPRVPVSVPVDAMAHLAVSHPFVPPGSNRGPVPTEDSVFTRLAWDKSFILYARQWEDDAKGRVFDDCAVVPLDRKSAAHVWAVLSYITSLETRNWPGTSYDAVFLKTFLPMADIEMPGKSFPRLRRWPPDYSSQLIPPVEVLRSNCALRYLARLKEGGSSRRYGDRDRIDAALSDILRRSCRRADRSDDARVSARLLSFHGGPTCLPALRAAARAASPRPPVFDKLARWPLIKVLFEPPADIKDLKGELDAAVWARGTLANMPAHEQLRLATSVWLNSSDSNLRWQAAQFLSKNYPVDFREACLKSFTTLPSNDKWGLLLSYRYYFGDDVRVAQVATRDDNPRIRAFAFYHVYRLMRDKDALAGFLDALLASGDPRQRVTWTLASFDNFRDDPQAVAFIAEFFRTRSPDILRREPLEFIARAGGKENIEFLESIMNAPSSQAPTPATFSPARAAADALAVSADPAARDAFLSYLQRPLDAEVTRTAVEDLADLGDERALPLFERLGKNPKYADWKSLIARCSLFIRLRNAADPLTFLVEMDQPARDTLLALDVVDDRSGSYYYLLVRYAFSVADVLAERLSAAELESALARDDAQAVRFVLYIALAKRRIADATSPFTLRPPP